MIVNGWKPLTIITKSSTLDVAAVLDQPLLSGPRHPSYFHVNHLIFFPDLYELQYFHIVKHFTTFSYLGKKGVVIG